MGPAFDSRLTHSFLGLTRDHLFFTLRNIARVQRQERASRQAGFLSKVSLIITPSSTRPEHHAAVEIHQNRKPKPKPSSIDVSWGITAPLKPATCPPRSITHSTEPSHKINRTETNNEEGKEKKEKSLSRPTFIIFPTKCPPPSSSLSSSSPHHPTPHVHHSTTSPTQSARPSPQDGSYKS